MKDSQWLARLMEVGLLRGSVLPPDDIRAMRDLTRYQTKLTEERSREKQRLLKVLEAAGIKLDNVALATGRPYQDLGHDFYTRRIDPQTQTRRLVAQLETLSGKKIIFVDEDGMAAA